MTGTLRDFFGTIRSRTRVLSAICSGSRFSPSGGSEPTSLKLKEKMVGAAGFEPTTP